VLGHTYHIQLGAMFCCMQMQLRFDGLLGFPGGLIDSTDHSVVDGLNRELAEEINFDVNRHRVTQNDFVMSCVCSHRKMVTHFYAIEVTAAQYEDIEKRVFTAHDWGFEVSVFHKIDFSQWSNHLYCYPVSINIIINNNNNNNSSTTMFMMLPS